MRDVKKALGHLTCRVLPALLLTGTVAETQSIQTLMLEGETIPGTLGTLSNILDVSVNDNGEWFVRTSIATPSGTAEAAILNGAAVLNAGDDLFDPAGLQVVRFDDVDLSSDGTLWWNITTDADLASDQILYRNLTLVSREGSPVDDPDQPFGTTWRDFDGFQLNSAGELLVLGDMDSPAVFGTSEAVLVLQTFDALGNLATEEVLLMEGDAIPGTNDLVADVGINAGAHDVAHANGHWIAYVRSDAAPASNETILLDGDVIAREGATGPLIGTVWGRLQNTGVAITDAGEYVFRGEYVVIGGDTFRSIFKNGQPFITQGDTSQFISPFAFDSFGANTPVLLGENGNLVFYGTTDDSNTATDEGLFINDRFLVQENVTQVDAGVIGSLANAANTLAMSPNGRFVIFEAMLGNGTSGAFLVDLGLIAEMESCSTTPGTLAHVEGLPLLGETVLLQMDGEQDFGVTPVLMLSNDPIVGWPPCGLTLPFGELLIDISAGLGNPVLTLLGPPSEFLPVDFTITVPNDPTLLGRDFFAQGIWWDVGNQSPAANFRLTNGLEITLAPR